MGDAPDPLRGQLLDLLLHDRTAAWLEVSDAMRVLRSGGDLAAFGLESAVEDVEVLGYASFLVGLIPVQSGPLVLPQVKTANGRYADVHVSSTGGRTLVLVVDATPQAERLATLQQWGNDLQLDRERDAARGDRETRERRGRAQTLTAAVFLLRVDPHEHQTTAPEAVLSLRQRGLASLALCVSEHAGFMHRHSVTESLALFGILPSDGSPAYQAAAAAVDAVDSVRELAPRTDTPTPFTIHVAAGIATGEAVLGNSAVGNSVVPAVFGDPVDRALNLALRAPPHGVLADESTWSSCDSPGQPLAAERLSESASGSPLFLFERG